VSYDNVAQIRDMYRNFKKKEYSLKHTAHAAKEGSEVLFFSNTIKLPYGDWTPFDFKNDYRLSNN
jgi:DNA adenine methylase